MIDEKKLASEDAFNNDFEILNYNMLEKAAEKKYKKEAGWILKAVNGVPTHYEDYLEYGDYLDELFELIR